MPLRRMLALVMSLGATSAIAADGRPALGPNYAAPAGIGSELLGTRPPEWKVTGWLNSSPLTLAELRGKVVLVRWWTGPQCPYCSASAEALNTLWEKHRRDGLVVIGMYHHKADTPLTPEHVKAQTKRLGFEFPIAADEDWITLHKWWLDRQPRGWTSVTFLLDREGKIRHIHPGGAYYPSEPGYTALKSAVEKALKENQ
jgi:peroxiredoxin